MAKIKDMNNQLRRELIHNGGNFNGNLHKINQNLVSKQV